MLFPHVTYSRARAGARRAFAVAPPVALQDLGVRERTLVPVSARLQDPPARRARRTALSPIPRAF